MYYVIMDLEWNNIFVKKFRGYINEIIEIGAVLTDDALQVIDTFSCLVRPIKGKKLTSQVKQLTHITNEDLKTQGIPFDEAIRRFRVWLPSENVVFLTWGNSDLRAMLDNYAYFFGTDHVPFIERYANLQNFCQSVVSPESANQIGLVSAAETLSVSIDAYQAHRALDDSFIAYECLKKCYDAARLQKYIKQCDKSFYKRLRFKAVTITDIHHPSVDPNLLSCRCDICGGRMTLCGDWRTGQFGFKGVFGCRECNIFKRCTLKFVELADGMDIKLSYRNAYEINGNENDD